MVSVENIREYLDNNPDEKKVVEAQAEYFFPIWISEKDKLFAVKALPKEDLEFLFQIMLINSISISEISESSKNEKFIDIKMKLENVKDGNEDLLHDIKKIYLDNFNNSINEYSAKIEQYKYKKLPKKKKNQIDNLRNNGKIDIAERIINDYYESHNSNYAKLIEKFNRLKEKVDLIDIDVFSSKALGLNPHLVEKVAYAVCNPVSIFKKEIDEILNDSVPLSCDWYLYRELTRPEYDEFIKSISDSKTWNKQFIHTIKNIKEKIEVPILPIIKRKHLIEDIISNLSEGRYESALIIMFSIIEGLLWEIAFEVNKKKKVFISESEVFDYKNDCNFESTRIRDILERTYVSEYLDEKFLKYFCEELYEERNPVLHGRHICRECNNEAHCIIEKVFTLDYVLSRLCDIYKKHLFDLWDEGFDDDKIKYYLDLFYGKK